MSYRPKGTSDPLATGSDTTEHYGGSTEHATDTSQMTASA